MEQAPQQAPAAIKFKYMYPFKNLVFQGGGVKGIAYGGALDVLDKKGILKNIIRVAGTSAGAINATYWR